MYACGFGLPSALVTAARTQIAAARSLSRPATASLTLPRFTRSTLRTAPQRMLPAQRRRTAPVKPIGRHASPLISPPASRDAPGAAAAADADVPAVERYPSFLPTVALANDGPNAAFDVADAETAAGPTASPAPESTESDSDALAAASMSAFAKMRARKREAEVTDAPAVASTPSATPPASSSWRVESSLSGDHLHRPREPGPGECCGRDCANCVWIQYAQALAEYDEKVQAFKRAEMLSAGPPTPEPKPAAAVADAPSRELTRFERAMAKERAAATKARANSPPPPSEGR